MRSLLVFDGAMGSLLYERGIFVMQNFEQLNVTRPDVVAKIHEDYVNAGANIIETNTYGANSFRLDRHGLGDQVRAFNLAGARLARKAAGEDVWVAGSMGPIGLVPGVATQAELDLASATFAEQAAALVEGGADVLVLETFRHLEEIRIAIEAARHGAPDTPIIATMAFDPSETVADGSGPEHVATTVARLGRGRARRELRRRPADRARHRRAHARGGSAAVRATKRRAAAYGGRPPPLYGDARVLRRLRAPHDPDRRHDGGWLLRHRRPSTSVGWRSPRACSATSALTSGGRTR
jgi:hypothetical protein